MIRRNTTHERLVALFILGVVLLVPPVLAVFNREDRVLGVPLLYLYLFAAWALLIALAALVAVRIVPDADAAPPDGATASGGPEAGAEAARDA
ncbi:MAG: hypothetical protein IT556_02005 [Acetobacteraceae bacterium]|nr:hypothetical protein [Acetobacteraceae bacterium]